ncbi:MAG TPA: hypothetical protein VM009_05615 [Terriglobales bacterium]|nr:hypothetical protein [Terriglobales bacterium]
MKNEKALSGLAYMFLGAVLVGGSSVQDQFNRLASDPDVQLAKTMYKSLLNTAKGTVAEAKTQVLAKTVAAPMEIDYAVAPEPVVARHEAPADPIAVEVQVSEVPVAPKRIEVAVSVPRFKIATLQNVAKNELFREVAMNLPQGLSQGEVARINAQISAAQAQAASFKALTAIDRSELRRVVMIHTAAKVAEKCSDAEDKNEDESKSGIESRTEL